MSRDADLCDPAKHPFRESRKRLEAVRTGIGKGSYNQRKRRVVYPDSDGTEDYVFNFNGGSTYKDEDGYGPTMVVSDGVDFCKFVSKMVVLNTPKTITFMLSGWGSANSAWMGKDAQTGHLRTFRVVANILYADMRRVRCARFDPDKRHETGGVLTRFSSGLF